jgi:hypothetical protein
VKKQKKRNLISAILNLDDISNIIHELILSYMSYNITYEDLEAIKNNAFNKEEKILDNILLF